MGTLKAKGRRLKTKLVTMKPSFAKAKHGEKINEEEEFDAFLSQQNGPVRKRLPVQKWLDDLLRDSPFASNSMICATLDSMQDGSDGECPSNADSTGRKDSLEVHMSDTDPQFTVDVDDLEKQKLKCNVRGAIEADQKKYIDHLLRRIRGETN
ncbi:hypothetical protein K470DRAFT_270142 [Piedraia hortae CBS 480.64]|uniref:Uncharacterized protein n=1 Tax=Piedraia hortae CBS 480.64 TaxID=1314780 RepID=A0A6A7C2D1_9PEZI|nr:hypothetical protein K470DRAFT_270142 [Piedraia hortae CBS 480.64]